jgi:two-component system chemotaxis response regulator CheB
MNVVVADDGIILKSGTVYIAPGEKHMEVAVRNEKPVLKIYQGTPVNFCMPSIDVLFYSAARIFRNRTLGVLLTGMGSDGVNGLGVIQNVGGKTIAESEETCILFAMPKFAAEKGFVDLVLPNYEIGQELIKFSRK